MAIYVRYRAPRVDKYPSAFLAHDPMSYIFLAGQCRTFDVGLRDASHVTHSRPTQDDSERRTSHFADDNS